MMPRHCVRCHRITPASQVNFCPHCGKEFGNRTHPPTLGKRRPPLVSLLSDRTSLALEYERRLPITPTSVRTRLPSFSVPSYSSKFRPIIADRKVERDDSDDSHNISASCQYKIICGEYLASLKWEESFFNRQQNRCYCHECYPISRRDTYTTGGSTYVVPRGWCRFGLRVDDVRARADHIWDEWIITYHGTSPIAAQSIVMHRQFLIPGDKCIDGSIIRIHDNHIKDKREIYTSPTIAYSSHPCYCLTQHFRSRLTNKLYNARTVLQCRQKPGAFKIQGETIGAGHRRICSIIPNEQIEILTTIRAAIVPYGVLIHLAEANSNDS